MKSAGLQVESDQETVAEIARQNHRSPEEILAYFVP